MFVLLELVLLQLLDQLGCARRFMVEGLVLLAESAYVDSFRFV